MQYTRAALRLWTTAEMRFNLMIRLQGCRPHSLKRGLSAPSAANVKRGSAATSHVHAPTSKTLLLAIVKKAQLELFVQLVQSFSPRF